MTRIAQVDRVVADIDRARDFYALLGFAFQPIVQPGGPTVAWASPGQPSLVLHDVAFARWWDATHPGAGASGTVIDCEVDDADELDALVARIAAHGATVASHAVDMPWGVRMAVVLDPDGHRVGLQSPPRG